MRKIDYSKLQNCEQLYLQKLGFYDDHNNKTPEYTNLQQQWNDFKDNYVKTLKCNCLYPKEAKDVLVGEFKDIVKIYIDFTKKKIKDNFPDLYENAKSIFNYDFKFNTNYNYTPNTSKSGLIADFFKDHDELDLTTCFYCDAAYINHFTSKKKYRMYDLDHFLEKAECPILALSLFNFVPSCQICNSKVKGSKKPINQYGIINTQDLEDYLIHLSPTCSDYNFENTVTIEINPLDCNKATNYSDYNNFKIEFVTNDKYSLADIKGFMLEERYNYANTKGEAINLLRLKDKYPDSYISQISTTLTNNGIPIPEDEIKEDIFHLFSDLKNRRIFSKMKEDIITK
ncbi:MAG: hypothetical protein UIB61_06020 [Treponema sp.]|nr:hypothetical protein [Treponema sp.]